MSCGPNANVPSENIVEFNVRYIHNGTLAGNIVLANDKSQYELSCSGYCNPIQASIPTNLTSPCCDLENPPNELLGQLSTCFEESPNWINGVVVSFGEDYSNVETANLTFVSYFNRLSSKPVNSQLFYGELLSNVIPIISNYYAGIPSYLRSYTISDTVIKGPIQGESIYEELRLLAQAGKSHFFVQVGGFLTMEPWRDNTDLPEYTIPQEMIYNIQRADYASPNINYIKCRGASIPQFDCGEVPFTDSRITDGSGGVESIPGYSEKSVFSGVPTPTIKADFANLAASAEDLKNASYVSDNITIEGIENVEDGSLLSVFKKNDGSFFGPIADRFKILIYGKRKDSGEFINGDQNTPLLTERQQKSQNNLAAISSYILSGSNQYPIPMGSFGNTFGVGFAAAWNNAYSSEENSLSAVETFAINPSISVCGTRAEEIQNKYVVCKERLFDIAVRRFQEMKLEANTWNIEIPYIPCLRLNQVVEFEIPKRFGLPTETVIGVIAGIDLSFNAQTAEATMKIALWDTSCLGQDIYTSGNLVSFSCGGDNPSLINPFVTSALGIEANSGVDGGNGWLFAAGTSQAFIELNQDCMTPGDSYVVSFSYETFGANNFLFTGPGISQVISGSGNFSQAFFATLNSHQFIWGMVGNSIPTYVKITNISITKTVLA